MAGSTNLRGAAADSAAQSAILRVSGHGRDKDETVEWSLVLKALHPPTDRGQLSDWDYWRREAHAFESGLLDGLPGGLAAPRCFSVADQPDGECWIWMEDLRDEIGAEWPLEHYGVVARHLGQFNSAYLTGRPLPSWPWLSRGWLRGAVAGAAPAIAQLRHAADHPLLRRAYPPEVVEGLLARWAERETVLEALDRLPQTLCHFDPFRRNLFARRTSDGRDETVAIDWAGVGIGALGWDIHILVCSTLVWGEIDPSHTRELDGIVFGGYLEGLKDAGWRGDPRQVRFGQIAPLSLWNIRILPPLLSILVDETRHAWLEETFGHSPAEFADRIAESWIHPLTPGHWEAEARELMDSM